MDKFSYLDLDAPDEVRLPSPMGLPIAELGEPLNGFQCADEGCGFMTTSGRVFKTHCREAHKISWTGDTSRLYAAVKVQTFFRTGGMQRYFIVNVQEGSDRSRRTGMEDVDAEVAVLLGEWKETEDAQQKKMHIMAAEAAKTDKTNWFKRTGWLEHLANRNRKHLAHAIRRPE